jgi:hypothetical protein
MLICKPDLRDLKHVFCARNHIRDALVDSSGVVEGSGEAFECAFCHVVWIASIKNRHV